MVGLQILILNLGRLHLPQFVEKEEKDSIFVELRKGKEADRSLSMHH